MKEIIMNIGGCYIHIPIKYIDFKYYIAHVSKYDEDYEFVAKIDLFFAKNQKHYRASLMIVSEDPYSKKEKYKIEKEGITLYEALVIRKYRVKDIVLFSDTPIFLKIYQPHLMECNHQKIDIQQNILELSVSASCDYLPKNRIYNTKVGN